MLQEITAPRGAELEVGRNLERLNDKVFTDRLRGYKSLFRRNDALVRETHAVNSSLAANTLLRENGAKGTFHAEIALAIERRLDHPIKLDDYKKDIGQAADAIQKTADSCGLDATADNFNLQALTECCLDQMGIEDKSPGKFHPRDIKLFRAIDNNLRYLDADADVIKREISSYEKPDRPDSWSEELDYIATHDTAVREFIATGSRTGALTVAILEDTKLEGSLTPIERTIARKLAEKISTVAKACDYDPRERNIDMEQIIQKQFLVLLGVDLGIIG